MENSPEIHVQMPSQRPALLLVPTPLDFGLDLAGEAAWPLSASLPWATIEAASRTRHWICENAKSLRAFLKRVDAVCPLQTPLQQLDIRELPRSVHKHGDHAAGNAKLNAKDWLQPIAHGESVALASEAGMPCVADPGSSLVRSAHAAQIAVTALPGPSALLSALAASGLGGQSFAFVGYLPTDAASRSKRIRDLEARSVQHGQTQLCIETPYRNQALFDAFCNTLQAQTLLCLAQALHTPLEQVKTLTVADWRTRRQAVTAVPTVFVF